MTSEHAATKRFAEMLGGEPYLAEGQENFLAPPRPDYVIMPSGYAVSTDYCSYYHARAANDAPQMSADEYLLRLVASGEQGALNSADGQQYDPRTNQVDPIANGGTGQPSPTLLPYYPSTA